jgi:cobalt-zinc-cadmium efflux system protein
MQGTPEGIRIDPLVEAVEAQPDVVDMHHVHLWTTDGTEVFLEAHVAVCEEARSRTDELLARLSERIRQDFGIGHVTLQFEFACCVGGCCSGRDVSHSG